MRSICFVCHGNICRSVMAEYILKSKTNNIYCESRATSYEEIGRDIYPQAKACLDRHNIKYGIHHARIMSQSDYDKFAEIYVMEDYNFKELQYEINDYDNKIKKLCSYDIEDPWWSDNFELVYKQLDEAIDKLIKKYEIIK